MGMCYVVGNSEKCSGSQVLSYWRAARRRNEDGGRSHTSYSTHISK